MSTSAPYSARRVAAAAAVLAALLTLLIAPCCSPQSPADATATPAPVSSPTRSSQQPLSTSSFGLTLPFAKEGNTGREPVFVTVEDVPVVGFYVKLGGLVLAPHEASLVEVLLVTESTALLNEGGIVMNFIHPAGFATQVYLWQGEAVQQDKSGTLRPLVLTPERPTMSYGPVYRGEVVGIVGEAFPQSDFQGATLLLTLAAENEGYLSPNTLWLNGKLQYVATPTPQP